MSAAQDGRSTSIVFDITLRVFLVVEDFFFPRSCADHEEDREADEEVLDA
jgi:hypothetical protein